MKKIILTSLFFSIAFFLTAAEKKPNPRQDLEKIRLHLRTQGRGKTPWVWIFYGDSITHGAKHTRGWRSFPEIFAERLRYELRLHLDTVINSGISGNTTRELLDDTQYYHRIKKFHPSVVIVMIGTNDIVRLKNVDLYRKNLETLVEKLRKDKAVPVLMTLPGIWKKTTKSGYVARLKGLEAYNAAIRETAKKYNTVLIDNASLWEKTASTPEKQALLLGEEIHPGPWGHLEIAKEIFRVFDIYDASAASCNPIGKEPQTITHLLPKKAKVLNK